MIFLSEEHIRLRNIVHDFADKELAAVADELDQSGKFGIKNFIRMAELGLFGANVPVRFQGSNTGGGTLSYALIIEELARVCASTAFIYHNQTSCIGGINIAGSDEQKEKYLPSLICGESFGAIAITEPEAGSDVAAVKTTAVRKDDHYILNGMKTFISNGPVCDVAWVAARITDLGKHGLTLFIIENGTPGFVKGREFNKLGVRGSATGELFFEDCHIPLSNRVGEEGKGLRNALRLLDYGRIGMAGIAIGIAQGVLEKCVEYAKRRVQFGHPICQNQGVAWKLADVATELEAARLLNYKAAYLADEEMPFSKEAAMAKLHASELCMKAAIDGIQIFGGYGYMMDSPMQRFFRDAKITAIAEGTSEIQRLIISKTVLQSND